MARNNKANTYLLQVLSANVRGLLTNIGDYTHSFINRYNADVVVAVETFFNESVPNNFGRIKGYSNWCRKDRIGREKGGIAVCFKDNLHVQPLDVTVPTHLEILFHKVYLKNSISALICTCYRPQWQGTEPIDFLHNNLDDIMVKYSCQHLIIVGDMNQNIIKRSFENLLSVYGLTNHVSFPTHISGSSLDPVITDLPESLVSCQPLGFVGSSDHKVIHTKINIAPNYDKSYERIIWLWDRADWKNLRIALEQINWDEVLKGDADRQAEAFTNVLIEKMYEYVPHRIYKVRASDQPWFGHQCRKAADEKIKAWNRYKRCPTARNKLLHRDACKKMEEVQKWAMQRWQEDLKRKLSGRTVGSKGWWQLIKQQQGFNDDDMIPPLFGPNGNVAVSGEEKANLLASHFAAKMQVPEPNRNPPTVPKKTNKKLSLCLTNKSQVENFLKNMDVKKAIGPDTISPHILKKCASQLSEPLARLFNFCSIMKIWPKIWKIARVVACHKKKRPTKVENYRPISLLSVVGKIYEKVLAISITEHLEQNRLLSLKQFGFRKERATSDILLQMTSKWNASLDSGIDTYVIALDIAGAFDRVWHAGLLAKIKSYGIDDEILDLITDYLKDRLFKVVVSGFESREHKIEASVPQGSVLGPIFWNIFFDDILHLVPEAQAFADDCTLSFGCVDRNHGQTIHHINEVLKIIISWSKKWQVTLAAEKTQLMLISRRPKPLNVPRILLDNEHISLQTSINILGVQFDEKLTFTEHVKELASRAAKKFACLRRVAHLLDEKGCTMLYNSQIRSIMEYAPLVWSSCPPSYNALLDRIQERVRRLIDSKRNMENPVTLQPLCHRRAVSGLCVFYKAHVMLCPHLSDLRLPAARVTSYQTRETTTTGKEVQVPFARTALYMRSFHPFYSRVWNSIVWIFDNENITTLSNFKKTINKHLLQNPGILQPLVT